MRPEYKQTPAQKELRKLCGGIVPDSVARRVLKILNQVVDDPQLIKIESSGVPTTEDIRQRRLELDKLLQTPPVDEEIARDVYKRQSGNWTKAPRGGLRPRQL